MTLETEFISDILFVFFVLFQEEKVLKSDIEETKLSTNDTTVTIEIGNPVKNVKKEVNFFVICKEHFEFSVFSNW